VAARLGWDGKGERTLAAAGAAEGYSRERVRQLEERVREHARRTPTELAATRAALRLVEEAAPIGADQVAALLSAGGLSGSRFELGGLLTAAEMIGVDPGIHERDGVVLHRDQAAVAVQTSLLARRLVARNGVARVEEVTLRLGGGVSTATVRRLLEVRHDVTWLGERRSWFLINGSTSRATRTLQKMLTISPALSIAEAGDGLRRSLRPVKLPLNVVRLLCEAQPWLTVNRAMDSVTTAVALDAEQTLTPLERRLVAIFHRDGPTLTFSQAVDLAERDGLNPGSVRCYLVYTPVLKARARGIYSLRGRGG
jgi:hypothetical protein